MINKILKVVDVVLDVVDFLVSAVKSIREEKGKKNICDNCRSYEGEEYFVQGLRRRLCGVCAYEFEKRGIRVARVS